MTMSGMTGDKLSGELLKIRLDIPIILCTGYSELIPKEKAASLGTKGFLMKPVSIRELSEMIRNVLDAVIRHP
jgi:FixJ family two-component response regulator